MLLCTVICFVCVFNSKQMPSFWMYLTWGCILSSCIFSAMLCHFLMTELSWFSFQSYEPFLLPGHIFTTGGSLSLEQTPGLLIILNNPKTVKACLFSYSTPTQMRQKAISPSTTRKLKSCRSVSLFSFCL